jgi:uncharacterized protein YkwD
MVWALAGMLSPIAAGSQMRCLPPGHFPDDNVDPAILAMEQDAFDEVNDQRISHGLDPLTMDEDPRVVARNHSRDIAARHFFDHINPDRKDPFDRMADAGITYTRAGENTAYAAGYSDRATVVVNRWMNSTGHRDNILREGFTILE